MAITITKQPNPAAFNPYGNNIIFEFEDSSETDYAIIGLGNISLRIYPINDIYYINLKNVIRSYVDNKDLLDLSLGAQLTSVQSPFYISTYKNNNVVSELATARFTFVPTSYNYQDNNVIPMITHRYSFSPLKVMRFGSLPLFYYSWANNYNDIEKTSFAPPEVTTITTTDDCGIYLKFFSNGAYNYWLFKEGQTNRNITNLGEVFNDFNDLENTTSPYLQLGKESRDSINITSGMLEDWEDTIVKPILTSPKIYMYKTASNSWIEVSISNTSVKTNDNKGRLTEYNLTLVLPPNNNLTL